MSIDKVSMSDEQMDKVIGGTTVFHTVQANDTPDTIAAHFQKFGVTVDMLKAWNPGIDFSQPLTVGAQVKVLI